MSSGGGATKSGKKLKKKSATLIDEHYHHKDSFAEKSPLPKAKLSSTSTHQEKKIATPTSVQPKKAQVGGRMSKAEEHIRDILKLMKRDKQNAFRYI